MASAESLPYKVTLLRSGDEALDPWGKPHRFLEQVTVGGGWQEECSCSRVGGAKEQGAGRTWDWSRSDVLPPLWEAVTTPRRRAGRGDRNPETAAAWRRSRERGAADHGEQAGKDSGLQMPRTHSPLSLP